VAWSVVHELAEAHGGGHWRPSYFAAWVDNKLVGFAGWNYSWVNYDVYELCWCNVLPDFQGNGIGRGLVEARLHAIRQIGGRVVLLTTHRPEIYERYGFKSLIEFRLLAGKTHLMSLELEPQDVEPCV
jgi:GNAT superfamily N-acetyltransferase